MRHRRAFTLVEIVLAVFILMLLLLLADRRLRRSLDSFNNLVRQAQERSVAERRSYLITWDKDHVFLRPETFAKGEKIKPIAEFQLDRGDALKLALSAALTKNPKSEWIFWPSGTCEPATVQFNGSAGSWKADYSALTSRPELTNYAAR